MNKYCILITTLLSTIINPGPQKKMTVHHEPGVHFDIDTLPLESKLKIILKYALELESGLPEKTYPDKLSNRQLASNIRIFTQSALKPTPPCKECIKAREHSKQQT